jgi:hypothetical protein
VNKFLKKIFNINSIYLTIPLLLIIIYGPGVIMAFNNLGPTREVIEFLAIFVLSLFVYFITHYFIKHLNNRKLVINKGVSVVRLAQITFFLYFLYIVYVVITAPKIPLVQAFLGASSTDLAFYREMFFKARTGFDSILVYINAIFTVAILPFLLASLYIIKYKYRHLYLIFFIGTLLLSMEKSLIARALLPLIILVINGIVIEKYLSLKKILIILIVGLVGITFLSLGNFSNSQSIVLKDVIDVDPATAKYFIVSNPDNAFMFLLNRIFWIPYITAIDWLLYFNQVLHEKVVMGASSSLISGAFGLERVNLERLVFEFEWGQNDSGTGSSNTVYFIDIFLNFGWMGVIFSNMILAGIVSFFEFCNNNAAKATFFVYAYFIVTSSLIAVIFSSGLLFLMFLMLIVKNKY